MRIKQPHTSCRITRMILAIACLSVGISGCAPMLARPNKPLMVDPKVAAESGVYRVEISRGVQPAVAYTGTLESPTTVQQALEKSGAIKRHRNMKITVLRKVEETGRLLHMEVDYSPSKKRVPPEQDYAIHPGDRILVEGISGNLLGKVIDSVKGK